MVNEDNINRIRCELSIRIKGTVETEVYSLNLNPVLHIIITNNGTFESFVNSFSMEYLNVIFNGDDRTIKIIEQYIVDTVCANYRNYILRQYFKEV